MIIVIPTRIPGASKKELRHLWHRKYAADIQNGDLHLSIRPT